MRLNIADDGARTLGLPRYKRTTVCILGNSAEIRQWSCSGRAFENKVLECPHGIVKILMRCLSNDMDYRTSYYLPDNQIGATNWV